MGRARLSAAPDVPHPYVVAAPLLRSGCRTVLRATYIDRTGTTTVVATVTSRPYGRVRIS